VRKQFIQPKTLKHSGIAVSREVIDASDFEQLWRRAENHSDQIVAKREVGKYALYLATKHEIKRMAKFNPKSLGNIATKPIVTRLASNLPKKMWRPKDVEVNHWIAISNEHRTAIAAMLLEQDIDDYISEREQIDLLLRESTGFTSNRILGAKNLPHISAFYLQNRPNPTQTEPYLRLAETLIPPGTTFKLSHVMISDTNSYRH